MIPLTDHHYLMKTILDFDVPDETFDGKLLGNFLRTCESMDYPNQNNRPVLSVLSREQLLRTRKISLLDLPLVLSTIPQPAAIWK